MSTADRLQTKYLFKKSSFSFKSDWTFNINCPLKSDWTYEPSKLFFKIFLTLEICRPLIIWSHMGHITPKKSQVHILRCRANKLEIKCFCERISLWVWDSSAISGLSGKLAIIATTSRRKKGWKSIWLFHEGEPQRAVSFVHDDRLQSGVITHFPNDLDKSALTLNSNLSPQFGDWILVLSLSIIYLDVFTCLLFSEISVLSRMKQVGDVSTLDPASDR